MASDPVGKLLSMMKLGERFGFYILIGKDQDLARALVRFEEDRSVVCLAPERPNPYPQWPAWHLINIVFAALVFSSWRKSTPDNLFVIDARATNFATEDDWIALFRRMNERRNLIAKKVGGPLLLVGSQRLYELFAKWAPDLWSIRSHAAFLGPAKGAE